ncbi:DegT/DnrJ/EryC1/StrS family aminotransferase [Candidatus Saccharibacteria bacterium]|nr:DegT/DnrJ/EryC1/StrS family aminotransferase [Candidatus Saccharibacteria bacterium]
MYFLGLASNLKGKTAHHLFTFGKKRDSESLKSYLAGIFDAEVKNVALTSNGRSALCLTLKSLIPENSEVVLNGFTCRAVLVAIREANCTPVFADIDEKTLNFTPKTLESLLESHKNIKAVIIQNTLGNTVDIKKFESIAKKHHLALIEDLAHCVGQKYPDGRLVGSVGNAAALSFGKGKVLDTSTGGALILRTPAVFPQKYPKKHPRFSSNFRARWYPVFGTIIRALYRVHLNKYLTALLLKLHFIERSADAPLDLTRRPAHWQSKLILEQLEKMPKSPTKIRSFDLVENRDVLLKTLRKKGFVFGEIWYDTPVSPARYYKNSGFDEKACPIATEVAKTIINLPSWYEKSALAPAEKLIIKHKKETNHD